VEAEEAVQAPLVSITVTLEVPVAVAEFEILPQQQQAQDRPELQDRDFLAVQEFIEPV
jgi:hypothetical protein